jgi:hypothetical protein
VVAKQGQGFGQRLRGPGVGRVITKRQDFKWGAVRVQFIIRMLRGNGSGAFDCSQAVQNNGSPSPLQPARNQRRAATR